MRSNGTGKQARRSFLKKTTKKLLFNAGLRQRFAKALSKSRFFCLFFVRKKTVLTFCVCHARRLNVPHRDLAISSSPRFGGLTVMMLRSPKRIRPKRANA
jgi:hypothetical protein